MAITYSFVDNAVYGADDINGITGNLSGAGIAPFLTKESYNVSDFNVLTAEAVEAGVSLEGCKCTLLDSGTEKMKVTVAQGIVFFESGVTLTVDSEGYTISLSPNTAGYVYAHYSPSLQKADILFAASLPLDGEYVVLAEISVNGDIEDKRVFARSKIATMGRNVSLKASFEDIEPVLIKEENGNRSYAVAVARGVDLSNFNYALVTSGEFSSELPYACFYDLANGEAMFSLYGSRGTAAVSDIFMTAINYSMWYAVGLFGGELCIVARCSIVNSGEKYLGKDSFEAYTAVFM